MKTRMYHSVSIIRKSTDSILEYVKLPEIMQAARIRTFVSDMYPGWSIFDLQYNPAAPENVEFEGN